MSAESGGGVVVSGREETRPRRMIICGCSPRQKRCAMKLRNVGSSRGWVWNAAETPLAAAINSMRSSACPVASQLS